MRRMHRCPKGLVTSFYVSGLQKPELPENITLYQHSGRLRQETVQELVEDVGQRVVYLCGTPAFEDAALESLKNAGAEIGQVKREGFGY